MNFALTEDRQMLADTLARLFANRYPIETRHAAAYGEAGYSRELWAQLGELGIFGALFDERAGGFGGSGFDILVVFEALGRALAVEPLLGTLVVGRALAIAGGHDAALARIVAGEAIAAFAAEEADSRWEPGAIATRATPDGDGWRLDGAKTVVAQAEAAALLLVTARVAEDAAPALFLVPADAPGVSIRGYRNIDGGRSGDVTFAGVALERCARVGAPGTGLSLIEASGDVAVLALCAEALGAIERVKDMTLDYLRTRVQFGVVIGSFQALQHRMTRLLIELEQARSAVINAAAALDDAPLARARAASAAKVTIGQVAQHVAEEAIQLHGGIGMTWELPLSHYAKRLVMIDHLYGDEDHHLQRYIAVSAA